LIIIIKHIIRHKGGPTERARFLIVVDPTVHACAVENVLAVAQAPNLLLLGELEQAHCAQAVLLGANVGVSELGDGKEVADQERRRGWGPRRRSLVGGVGVVRPGDLGFEEVGESEEVEEEEYEVSEEAEEGQRVQERVREEHLRVTHRKTHRKINRRHGFVLGSEREKLRFWTASVEYIVTASVKHL